MPTWLTLPELRTGWADAPADDAELTELADAAQEQLEAYAPALALGQAVPARYRQALRLQVRELWQARRRDGDTIGLDDGYALRARPLGTTVRSLLRPNAAVPGVG